MHCNFTLLFLLVTSVLYSQNSNNNTLSELIANANVYRLAGEKDSSKYQELAEKLEALLKERPAIAQERTQKQMVKQYLKYFPSFECTYEVLEPKEELITTKGFNSPLNISFQCDHETLEADYQVTLGVSEEMRFKNDEEYIDLDNNQKKSFISTVKITRANENKDQNKIRFIFKYRAHRFNDILLKYFEFSNLNTIKVPNEFYKLKAEPVKSKRKRKKKKSIEPRSSLE